MMKPTQAERAVEIKIKAMNLTVTLIIESPIYNIIL
jgi:hypothetical protein